MSCFMLYDEFEALFERLEEHPKRHAAAIAVYCLIGQKCVQRMTDGKVPKSIITKTLAAWPPDMVSAAIADLYALGLWVEEDGQHTYRDWDLKQYTAEREMARREKHARRQRDYIGRKKARESGELTRQLTDHEARQLTAPTTTTTTTELKPQPEREDRDVDPGIQKPKPRSPRSRSGASVGSDPVFDHWVKVMGKNPAQCQLNAKRRAKLKERRQEGYTDEQLCRAIDGCKLSSWHMGDNDRNQQYNDLATILCDGSKVEQHIERLSQPTRPRSLRPGRMAPSPGTTAKDFENEEDFETQMARLKSLNGAKA